MIGVQLIPLLSSLLLAHGEYTSLVNPKTGAPCCGDRDCAVRDPCQTPDGREGLVIDQTCQPIPPDSILPIPSWDGLEHGCWLGGQLRCVIRAAGT